MFRDLIKFFFLSIISFSSVNCQDFGKLSIVATLPSLMNEISGIETSQNPNLIWMINDSGNSPELFGYNIDTQQVEKAIKITNVDNNDWEDLATDTEGNVYIGDFGNNMNDRQNLAIYKVGISQSDSITTKEAKIIRFHLEDQKKFPPKPKKRNFDIEAFFYLNEHLYLFTRNRQTKFSGFSKVYKLPATEGDYEAKLIGSFKTCNDPSDCQVTSAAINHANGDIALLSYNKVWIIRDYSKDKFLKGKINRIKLDHTSQKESIAFKNDSTLFISDERTHLKGGNLYLFRWDRE